MGKHSAEQVVNVAWVFGDHDTSAESVAAAGSLETARNTRALKVIADQQRDMNTLLRTLIARLDSLGTDGLHEVIRYHRRQVKAANIAAGVGGRRRPRREDP